MSSTVAKNMAPTRALRTIRRSSSALTTTAAAAPRRTYYSHELDSATKTPREYTPIEASILAAALPHVAAQGFTQTALRQGAQDVGYREVSTNLFPRGEFELVLWHLRAQRVGLKDGLPPGGYGEGADKEVASRVRELVVKRLRGNVEAGVQERLSEAIAIMSLAGNIPPSLRELFLLSDEIWFLSGDSAVDTSWYTKRASLASIYAATEIYSTKDQSTEGRDTHAFLESRLDEARTLGGAWRNVKEWAAFQGLATVNLARSWGARI